LLPSPAGVESRMRIAFTRWRSGGLFNRPSPRNRLLPKKKTLSGFEFVSGSADGASAMPAKWSRPAFSFRFYEGKISRALIDKSGYSRDPLQSGGFLGCWRRCQKIT
jgi:hypothetical protein